MYKIWQKLNFIYPVVVSTSCYFHTAVNGSLTTMQVLNKIIGKVYSIYDKIKIAVRISSRKGRI